jgi:hypothetical protein
MKNVDFSAFDKAVEQYSDSSVDQPETSTPSYGQDVVDVLASAGQGATLGFGDEALAALQATLAKPENVSWYEEYR